MSLDCSSRPPREIPYHDSRLFIMFLKRVSRQTWLLILLVVFCAVSLVIKENYPFSNYPMYSDPDPYAQVYFLADHEGKPLPLYEMAFVTSPNLGKILRKRQQERAKALKISVKDLSAEDQAAIGKELVSYLRSQSAYLTKSDKLPKAVQIMKTTIQFENGEVVERPEVVYAES